MFTVAVAGRPPFAPGSARRPSATGGPRRGVEALPPTLPRLFCRSRYFRFRARLKRLRSIAPRA
eukprot:6110099-Lingulodinium_polyedra.AAC.1